MRLCYVDSHSVLFRLAQQNLISYGGVETIQGNKIVVPYRPDVKLTWVCADDIGACAAPILANPRAHAGKAYPLRTDAASHAEVAELLSKVTGGAEQFKVEQLPIADWYKRVNEHGSIEVRQGPTHTQPFITASLVLHAAHPVRCPR